MKYTLKAFGVTKEILGGKEKSIDVQGQTVAALRQQLLNDYPRLSGLKSLMIAVNNAYADDTHVINERDEIALIPPVSGG